MKCPKCKADVSEESHFCSKCGTPLKDKADPSVSQTKTCFVSARFGPLMIFHKRWFTYNKIIQGDMHEYQEEAIA
jgi:predicted amidophosphoribosyltransferase